MPYRVYFFSPRSTKRNNKKQLCELCELCERIIGYAGDSILQAFNSFKNDGNKNGKVPELWDGGTAERIIDILIKEMNPVCINLQFDGKPPNL